MALPSYPVIAERIGITLCRGLRPQGGYCHLSKRAHEKGLAELTGSGVLVHWAERRPSYGGYRELTMLVAATRTPIGEPPWKRLFLQLRLAKSLLITAKLRPRADIWAEDMARLHAMAIAAPRSPERDRAVRWSQGH